MDLSAYRSFIETFGFPITVTIALIFALASRRKANGLTKSSFFVPGWVHDNLVHELDEVRSYYTAQLLESRLECQQRIREFRELYEAEHGFRKDLEVRFAEVNAREAEQTKLITALAKDFRSEAAESRKRRTP